MMLSDRTMGGLAPAFVHRRLLRAGRGFITGGPLGALGGFAGIGGGGGSPFPIPGPMGALPFVPLVAGCNPGFKRDAQGRCVKEGIVGVLQRGIPGGETGLQPGTDLVPFSLVPGGIPATPVQGIRLDCPRGFVLGNDNNCYFKGALPRALRKWKPARRPAISAGDMSTLNRADRLRGKVKRLATKSGFTCKTRR